MYHEYTLMLSQLILRYLQILLMLVAKFCCQDCFRRFAKKKFEIDCMEKMNEEIANTVTLQAGLRTLHESGPEIKRAISSDLEEIYGSDFPPVRR